MKSISKKNNKPSDVKATVVAAVVLNEDAHHRRDFSTLLYRALKVMSMSIQVKSFVKKGVQKKTGAFRSYRFWC